MVASNLSHRYLWGTAVDQILADEQVTSLQSAGEVLWPLGDHLGSVRDAIDSNGTVEIHRVYDAFGNFTESPSTASHLFAFTARPFDQDTLLQNNLHRWYDATVGRWLSEDPIGFAALDVDLCRYVNNDPLRRTDWHGLRSKELTTTQAKVVIRNALKRESGSREEPIYVLGVGDATGGMNSLGNGYRYYVADESDILARMAEAVAAEKKKVTKGECPCIGVLELRAHGHWGSGLQLTATFVPYSGLLRLADRLKASKLLCTQSGDIILVSLDYLPYSRVQSGHG